MQSESLELGKLIKVYRSNWYRILYALLSLFILFVLLSAFYALFAEWERTKINFGLVAVICLIGMVFFLNARKTIRDYQKWRVTRTVKLKIYEHGFVYASETKTLVFRWDEVGDITYTTILVSGGASGTVGRNVPVIHSISRSGDGEVIVIPETLNRQKLTGMIKQKINKNNS